MRSVLACVVLNLLMSCPGLGVAQENPEARALADQAYSMLYAQGLDLRARVHLRIINEGGGERERVFTMVRAQAKEGSPSVQRYFLFFHEPQDLRRMSFLVWKTGEGEDQRWLYLPAMDLVRRIAAKDARKGFAGSTLHYEDITGRDIRKDNFSILDHDGPDHLLMAEPKDPGSVEFTRYTILVDSSTLLPKRIEYYDRDGNPYRRFIVLSTRSVQGRASVIQAEMMDREAGTRTVVSYSDLEYGLGIELQRFHEGLLRNPPVEFIR